MSIIRAPRPEANFYTLDKRTSENPHLSWAARGLLIYLLGKPDHWRVSIEHLRKQTKQARIRTSRDGIYALLAELRDIGYVTLARNRDPDGRLGGAEYVVSETPKPPRPEVAEPDWGEPVPAGPTLTSTERAATIEGTEKTESNDEPQAEVAPSRTLGKGELNWPKQFDVEPELAEDYRRHCCDLGKPLTASAWKITCEALQALWDQGADLNASLRITMQNGWVMPVDPTRGKEGVIERRKRANRRQVEQDVRYAERANPPSHPDR